MGVTPTPGSGDNFFSPNRANDEYVREYNKAIDRAIDASGASTFDFDLTDPLNVAPGRGSLSLSLYLTIFNLTLQISGVQDWLLSQAESLKRKELTSAQADFILNSLTILNSQQTPVIKEKTFNLFDEIINLFTGYDESDEISDEEAGTFTKKVENNLVRDQADTEVVDDPGAPGGISASHTSITSDLDSGQAIPIFETSINQDELGFFEENQEIMQEIVAQNIDEAGSFGGVSTPFFANEQGVSGELTAEEVDSVVSAAIAANLLVRVDLINLLSEVNKGAETGRVEDAEALILLLADRRRLLALIEAILLAFAAAVAGAAGGVGGDDQGEVGKEEARKDAISAENAQIVQRTFELKQEAQQAADEAITEALEREQSVLKNDVEDRRIREETVDRLIGTLTALGESLPAALLILAEELERKNISSPSLGVSGDEVNELLDGLRTLFLENDILSTDRITILLSKINTIPRLSNKEKQRVQILTDLLALGLKLPEAKTTSIEPKTKAISIEPEDILNLLANEGLIGNAQTAVEAFKEITREDPRRKSLETDLLTEVGEIVGREVALNELQTLANENKEVNLAVLQFTLFPLVAEKRVNELSPILDLLAAGKEGRDAIEKIFKERIIDLGIPKEKGDKILELVKKQIDFEELFGLGRTILRGVLDENDLNNEIRGSDRA